jgi:hypothetical protein
MVEHINKAYYLPEANFIKKELMIIGRKPQIGISVKTDCNMVKHPVLKS